MLFGKMVQVLPNPIEGGFRAVYGIDNVESKHQLRNVLRLTFGNILFNNMNPNVTKTYICGGYTVKETAKDFKEILIFNGDLSKNGKKDVFMAVKAGNEIFLIKKNR